MAALWISSNARVDTHSICSPYRRGCKNPHTEVSFELLVRPFSLDIRRVRHFRLLTPRWQYLTVQRASFASERKRTRRGCRWYATAPVGATQLDFPIYLASKSTQNKSVNGRMMVTRLRFIDSFAEPWKMCNNCKQPFKNQLAIDLASAFVSFAEATYGHPDSNKFDKLKVLESLRLKSWRYQTCQECCLMKIIAR